MWMRSIIYVSAHEAIRKQLKVMLGISELDTILAIWAIEHLQMLQFYTVQGEIFLFFVLKFFVVLHMIPKKKKKPHEV